MRPIQSILVAVKDPYARSHPAIAKAGQIAGALGAKLELFHVHCQPLYTDPLFQPYKEVQQLQLQIRDRAKARLERLAQPLRRAGLSVTCTSNWDFPAADAVVRHAARQGADLIVADCHVAHHRAPWILRYTDWELLRLSQLPVLLVKRPRRYKKPVVLAALDPGHAFEKPAQLDSEVLAGADAICGALLGKLHAVHSYMPPMVNLNVADMSAPDFAKKLQKDSLAKAKKALDRVLAGVGLPASRRHLSLEHAANAIPETAHRIRAGIVVMGAMSRSGLKNLFIGNTAEQVLDALDCDVLVVKPTTFVRRVPTGVRGADLRIAAPVMM